MSNLISLLISKLDNLTPCVSKLIFHKALLFWLVVLTVLSVIAVTTKVIIKNACKEPFLWNRIWYLGWFLVDCQYWKKNCGLLWSWAIFEGVFFMFWGSKNLFFYFFENTIASALKSCWINNFHGNKTGFLGLHTFSNVNALHKGLLLQDWEFKLGKNESYQTLPAIIRTMQWGEILSAQEFEFDQI